FETADGPAWTKIPAGERRNCGPIVRGSRLPRWGTIRHHHWLSRPPANTYPYLGTRPADPLQSARASTSTTPRLSILLFRCQAYSVHLLLYRECGGGNLGVLRLECHWPRVMLRKEGAAVQPFGLKAGEQLDLVFLVAAGHEEQVLLREGC